MADLGDDVTYDAVVTNVLRAAYPEGNEPRFATPTHGRVIDNEGRAHNVPFHDYNCPICAKENDNAPS